MGCSVPCFFSICKSLKVGAFSSEFPRDHSKVPPFLSDFGICFSVELVKIGLF